MGLLRGKGNFIVVDENYIEWLRATDWGFREIGRMGCDVTPISLAEIEKFYEKADVVVSLLQSEGQIDKAYLRVDWLGRNVRYFEMRNYSEIAREHPQFVRVLKENIVIVYDYYNRCRYPDETLKRKFAVIN